MLDLRRAWGVLGDGFRDHELDEVAWRAVTAEGVTAEAASAYACDEMAWPALVDAHAHG